MNSTRPRKASQPLKWHGGKSYLAKWIHSLAPPSVADDPDGYTHRNIVFAGGLGEFWNWPHEGISEAVNDADQTLLDFLTVLREPSLFEEFQRKVWFMPLSEEAWRRAVASRPIEIVDRALAFFVRYRQSRQGLGRDYTTPTRRVRRGMNEQASAWLSAVDGLPECHQRLRGVELACRDFAAFIGQRDDVKALFYCDPPYLADTRTSGGEYGKHELSDERHSELLELLAGIEGRFMLSGYRSPLYDAWADRNGFVRHDREIDNKASGSKSKPKRVESIWCNY
ncbi:MAG: DNA adenine methylase [Planctomycetota bacterium]